MNTEMTDDRRELLQAIVHFDPAYPDLKLSIKSLGWDYEGKPFEMTSAAIASVLKRYESGELSSADIEWWANAIESREDLDFEAGFKEKLAEVINMLANPTLQTVSPRHIAHQFISSINMHDQ